MLNAHGVFLLIRKCITHSFPKVFTDTASERMKARHGMRNG